MLARLDDIPGVSRSRAESSGHYFLVEVAGDVTADGVTQAIAERAIEVLGRGGRLMQPEQAEAQLNARRRGEPWVTAEEARSLSFVEGRMVGVRVAAAIAERAGLSVEEREQLAEAVREEMFAHVERIYAGLTTAGRFFEAWPQIANRVVDRCDGWLGRARASSLLSDLIDHFRDGSPRT